MGGGESSLAVVAPEREANYLGKVRAFLPGERAGTTGERFVLLTSRTQTCCDKKRVCADDSCDCKLSAIHQMKWQRFKMMFNSLVCAVFWPSFVANPAHLGQTNKRVSVARSRDKPLLAIRQSLCQ